MPKRVHYPLPWHNTLLEVITALGNNATLVAIHASLCACGETVCERSVKRGLDKLITLGLLYSQPSPREPGQLGQTEYIYKHIVPAQLPLTNTIVLAAVRQLKEKASLLKIQNTLARQGFTTTVSTLQALLNGLMQADQIYPYRKAPTGVRKKTQKTIYRCIAD